MSERALRASHVKAIRLIRAGTDPEQVCETLRLRRASVEALERGYRNVPDDFLARLERALTINEKLRRLVAGLGNARRRSGIESE